MAVSPEFPNAAANARRLLSSFLVCLEAMEGITGIETATNEANSKLADIREQQATAADELIGAQKKLAAARSEAEATIAGAQETAKGVRAAMEREIGAAAIDVAKSIKDAQDEAARIIEEGKRKAADLVANSESAIVRHQQESLAKADELDALDMQINAKTDELAAIQANIDAIKAKFR